MREPGAALRAILRAQLLQPTDKNKNSPDGMFLSLHGDQLVLWLHILAAAVWIGGQLTIALLVPLVRQQPVLLAAVGRRYQWIAWSAFTILAVTGVANVKNAGIILPDLLSTPRGRTLLLKIVLVALSGLAAAAHAFIVAPRASSDSSARILSAVLGSTSLLAATLAALYGVLIAG